jgi:hypothetical protein
VLRTPDYSFGRAPQGGQTHAVVVDTVAFERDGFVAVRGAFDDEVARGCREAVAADVAVAGVLVDEPTTWRPLVRVMSPTGPASLAAATSPKLLEAYDELIGPGRWTLPTQVQGTTIARFPSEDYPGEVGWHVDGTFWNGTEFAAELTSKGRGLLGLVLFTDVGDDDAPTRLAVGSHLFVPPVLQAAGEAGLGGGEVVAHLEPSVTCRQVVHATGRAGDVFLCHPFLVHTATWPHRGTGPRLVAQPAVHTDEGFVLDGSDPSPVARAIVAGLKAR